MTAPDPLRDIVRLPGGEFIAEVVREITAVSNRLRLREELACKRGQAPIAENVRTAAFLAAGAEMLTVLRLDGQRSADAGKEPANVIVRAVQLSKQAFASIDKGVQP